mmetsp:Transcript_21158/g.43637  ORF Transcript_21158/g.43637 Transcript_21158/m.43637 type:complete len:82 (-) Transcript_21158:94-339(-)
MENPQVPEEVPVPEVSFQRLTWQSGEPSQGHSLLVLTLHQSQLTIHSTRPITDDLIEVLQAIGFAVPRQTRLLKKARVGGA